MNDTGLLIIIGILAAIIIAFIIVKVIQICGMSADERKKVLLTYLSGLVAIAEAQIGSGHGAEKLALVEKLFAEKAPLIYKGALLIMGKENLKELIEEALKQIKDNFGK